MHADTRLAPVELPVLLSEKDICDWLKLSRQALAKMVGRGAFPAPLRLGLRRKGWIKCEITAWLESRRCATPTTANGG